MRVLVTGGAGFIGSHTVEALLAAGHEVTVLDNLSTGNDKNLPPQVPLIEADIRYDDITAIFAGVKPEVVIHLAATQPANVSAKNYDPANYIEVNGIGTLNILEFCRKNKVGKIIYASSHRNTQGLWVNNKPVSEADGRSIKYNGEYSMFSISESAAQDCVLHYQAQYGLKGIIFRLPPVYGYGPHTEIFMNGKPIKTGFQIFIEKAMACQPLEIWGDSSKGRDIIYIKDVINAFIKAINNDEVNGIYNITSGYSLTLKEEAETIAEIFWGDNTTPKIIERPEIPNTIDSFVYNISKAKHELSWQPKYTFKDMLLDYLKEESNKQFGHLIEKRKKMFDEDTLK